MLPWSLKFALVYPMADAAALLEKTYQSWLDEQHGFEIVEDDDKRALVAYFVSKKRPLSSRPTDAQDDESWVNHWRDVVLEAGLKGPVSQNGFIRWLQSKGKDPAANIAGADTRSAAVMAVLVKHGIPVSIDLQSAITDADTVFEAGSEYVQSTSIEAICIMYMLELPGAEDIEWYERQKATKVGSALSSKYGSSQLATINITKMPRYSFLLRKARRGLLEHALLEKSGYTWSQYRSEMLRLLNAKGLSRVADRFHGIQSRLERLALHNLPLQKSFWFELFFCEWRGLGFPADWCEFAYSCVASTDSSVRARISLEHVPTFTNSDGTAAGAAPPAADPADALRAQLAQMQVPNFSVAPQGNDLALGQLAGLVGGMQGFGSTPQLNLPPAMMQTALLQAMQGLMGRAGGMGSQPEPEPKRIEELNCEFCGSEKHATSSCSHLHKARKDHQSAMKDKNSAEAAKRRAARDAAQASGTD